MGEARFAKGETHPMGKTVTISGKDYDFDALNDTAQKMATNVMAADARLEQLRAELAMIQLARDVYAKTLVENLPRGEGEATPPTHGVVH